MGTTRFVPCHLALRVGPIGVPESTETLGQSFDLPSSARGDAAGGSPNSGCGVRGRAGGLRAVWASTLGGIPADGDAAEQDREGVHPQDRQGEHRGEGHRPSAVGSSRPTRRSRRRPRSVARARLAWDPPSCVRRVIQSRHSCGAMTNETPATTAVTLIAVARAVHSRRTAKGIEPDARRHLGQQHQRPRSRPIGGRARSRRPAAGGCCR